MNIDLPSDGDLHAQARAYAVRHGVSYSEALTAVVESAQAQAQARPTATATREAQPSDDAQLHAQANDYAARHGVSYSEALQGVREGGAAGAAASAAQTLAGPIEIFRTGVHVDDMGTQRSFSQADLRVTAAAYDPSRHEAPLTLGHPLNDRPAYGWVAGLEVTSDGRLLMRARQIDPALAQTVKAGRYKKRSASFYRPDDLYNPVPGTWYLKHVAWLGAQPPAVKGLADVQFGACEHAVTFRL